MLMVRTRQVLRVDQSIASELDSKVERLLSSQQQGRNVLDTDVLLRFVFPMQIVVS